MSGSPKPATRGLNACGGEDGFPCRRGRGRARASDADRPTPTARRLAAASISPNPRRAYSGALRRLDDQGLAAYLAELHDQGRAPASAATADAADGDGHHSQATATAPPAAAARPAPPACTPPQNRGPRRA